MCNDVIGTYSYTNRVTFNSFLPVGLFKIKSIPAHRAYGYLMMEDNYDDEIEKAVNGILHWNYRKLTRFPEQLRLCGKSISDIYMKGNLLLQIPTWIANLESLTELHLCENRISFLPQEIGLLKSLVVLDVSRNKIGEIPDSLTSLKSLNVFYANENMIRRLPKNIGNMKALRILSVAQNRLEYLPESIYLCDSLEEIILNLNYLNTLPNSMFHLPNLKLLELSENAFVYLPSFRPIAEPRLFLGLTRYLDWLAYDLLLYIMQKDLHHEGPLGRNFLLLSPQLNVRLEPLVRGFSRIFTWKPGDRRVELKLPFSKPYRKEVGVPMLYELCMRYVYGKLRVPNAGESYSIHDTVNDWELPETIKKDLRSGPSAYCQTCGCALFKNMIIRIYHPNYENRNPDIAVHHRTRIIVCFCSPHCSKWDDGDGSLNLPYVFPHLLRTFTELDWTT